MGEQELRFKRTERITEIIVGLMVIFGLIIIWLPLSPKPDRVVVYIAAIFALFFTFAWHKLKISISPVNKSFLESLVHLLIIATIVHATGGTRSYFNFMYFLPNLDTATNSPKRYSIACGVFTAVLIFGETSIYDPTQFSFAILNSWGVALVAFYGGFLAREVAAVQQAASIATVEKEKAINKLKDEFLFIISHELRSPITAMRGYLELLTTEDNGRVEPAIKDYAASAFRQSNRLNDLIEQLLDISRLETGKLHLVNETFELSDFLKSVLEEIVPDVQERKMKLSFSLPQGKLEVYADKERVRGVIRQLIDNAFKYTGEFGQIWVTLSTKDGKAYISIADNGVGITPEELPHQFERFYKSPQKDSEQWESTGLELFLAKNVVEKMGGDISAESQVGKGSRFTFTLPLEKAS